MDNTSAKWKIRVIPLLFGTLILSGIFLPPSISAILDRNLINRMQMNPMEESLAVALSPLSTLEKIRLIGDAQQTNTLTLVQGKNLDREGVQQKLQDETEKLKQAGLFPAINLDFSAAENTQTIAHFYINRNEPAKNYICWTIHYNLEEISALFYVDDSSGQILKYSLIAKTVLDLAAPKTEISKLWAAYLGVEWVDHADRMYMLKSNERQTSEFSISELDILEKANLATPNQGLSSTAIDSTLTPARENYTALYRDNQQEHLFPIYLMDNGCSFGGDFSLRYQ